MKTTQQFQGDVALDGTADADAVTVAFSTMEDMAIAFTEITADVTRLAVTVATGTLSTTAVDAATMLDGAVVCRVKVPARACSRSAAEGQNK